MSLCNMNPFNGFFKQYFPDILPVYADSHQFVMEQRTDQYNDLLYAVEMLELADMKAPRSKILLEMWLLDNEERKPPIFRETNFSVGIWKSAFVPS